MVNFSETNTYIHSGREFIAPADQRGDDHFDLDAFEQSRPGPLTPSSDPSVLVSALAEKTETLTRREMRAISQLRKSQRSSRSLRIRMKGKEHLYRTHRDRNRKIIADLKTENKVLVGKNVRFQRHSEECKSALTKWKMREKTLLSRVGDRDREIERLKTQMEAMQKAHTTRVTELTQLIAQLKMTQENLEGEVLVIKNSLLEMTSKNEEYERCAATMKEKEAQLASVRITLQSQLELLVTMT